MGVVRGQVTVARCQGWCRPAGEARADANQDGEITWGDLEWLLEFLLNSED